MSDVVKLAVVFRAAADGVVSAYMGPVDSATSDEDRRHHEIMTMQRLARELPALSASYFAYASIADLFEKIAEVELGPRPPGPGEDPGAEPEVLGYLVTGQNYHWVTANKGAAERQLGLVPHAKLIELIEKPGARHG